MNQYDLFTWSNFQAVIIGALLGFVKALSQPTANIWQFLYVLVVAGFAGGAAALVFGPFLTDVIVWAVGARISKDAVWSFSNGFMGATGITCISYIGTLGATVVEAMASRVKKDVGGGDAGAP